MKNLKSFVLKVATPGPRLTLLSELGTRHLKSSAAAGIWQKKQRRCRLSLLSSAAAATCMQNSGRCRYFKKINSTKNDGIEIRYLMVKFQLHLRKLINYSSLLDVGSGYN